MSAGPFLDDVLDERFLGAEPAIQGADTHLGARRDLGRPGVESFFGDNEARGFHESPQ